jgi:hypothetical protein
MQQAIDEHSGGGQEQSDRLIAAEEAALLVAAGLLLLLNCVALESVVHGLVWLPVFANLISRQYSGGWTWPMQLSSLIFGQISPGSDTLYQDNHPNESIEF